MYLILGIFGSIIITYFWLKSQYTIWKKKNVPHPPVNLFFGNILDMMLQKKNIGQCYEAIYNQYRDLRYVGYYRMRTPSLILRDPELIKTVLVKEFQSFHDNDMEVDIKKDPLFGRNPFVLKGDKWKGTRAQAMSCLTSGKMKTLFPVMQDTCKQFIDFIIREQKSAGKDGLEAKEICAMFTTENVANCSFGISAQCFTEKNPQFREMGKKIVFPGFLSNLTTMIAFMIPSLANFLDIKIVPSDVGNFFRNIVKDVVKYRLENNIKRNDFLDNLLEIRNKDPKFDEENITAHCVGLFIDGFETSSIALSFILYELAANPEAQTQLRKEIDEAMTMGEVTYEVVQNLPYLDAVVNESLRLHPPAPFMMRRCTIPYSFPPPDNSEGPEVTIDKDTVLMVSIIGLHLDEKYFPEPQRFKPERFLGDNKDKITKYSYLPFGEGPRICLGQRFGVSQVKIALLYIIASLEVRLNPKTIQPLQQDPQYFLAANKGGLWLNFYERSK